MTRCIVIKVACMVKALFSQGIWRSEVEIWVSKTVEKSHSYKLFCPVKVDETLLQVATSDYNLFIASSTFICSSLFVIRSKVVFYRAPREHATYTLEQSAWVDPGCFLEGDSPLGTNSITDWWGKQILKAITKKRVSSQGWGEGASHPQHPPSRSSPDLLSLFFYSSYYWNSFKF